MPLRLTTKFTLVSALLVLGVAVAISIAYIAQISRLTIRRTELDDIVAADQVLLQAQHAVTESATSGNAPASGSSEDLRDYLQRGLEDSQGLSSEMDAVLANYPAVYEVSIADSNGRALVSSDPAMVSRQLPLHAPFSDLTRSSIYEQLRVIFGATQLYVVRAPFSLRLGDKVQPYGEVRVTVETGLLRTQIIPGLRSAGLLALGAVLLSTLLVSIVSRAMLSLSLRSIGNSTVIPPAISIRRLPKEMNPPLMNSARSVRKLLASASSCAGCAKSSARCAKT